MYKYTIYSYKLGYDDRYEFKYILCTSTEKFNELHSNVANGIFTFED